MHLFAQFEFRASIDPDEDVQQLQAGCDARAPGCRVQLNDPRSKVLLTMPMSVYPALRDYVATWQMGDSA
jgi:hypothetical protein